MRVAHVLPRHAATSTLAAAVLTLAACGGSEGGGSVEPPAGRAVAQLVLSAQAALAAGTSNVTLRVAPAYERANGERVALATQSAAFAAGSAQQPPFNLDITACLADTARRGADQGTGTAAVCVVHAALVLQSGTRTLDSLDVGPITVRAGGTATQSVSFAEVAGVRVTLEGGAPLPAGPLQLQPGQTLDLAAAAVDANGATLGRAVRWTASAPAVATVGETTGLVTGVGFGTGTVTAVAGGRETAVQVAVQAPVTVTLAGAGGGSVASDPAGISCAANTPAGCTALFAPGASVRLTATPDANSTFAGWSGACSGTDACVVTLDQARALTATFARRRVTLTVNLSGQGGGNVVVTGGNVSTPSTCALTAGQSAAACTVTADAGATVNLTQTANTGSRFGAWGGACAGITAQTCPLTPTADVTVAASFTLPPTPDSVSVNAVSNPAGVSLTGTLGATVFVNGSAVGSQFSFPLRSPSSTGTPAEQRVAGIETDPSSPVTLRFEPGTTARLVSWGGACAGTAVTNPTGASTCTFTSSRNSQVTVTLAPR